MLAVFNKSIAKIDPAMKNPESESFSAMADCVLARELLTYYPHATTLNFSVSGYMAIDEGPGVKRYISCQEDLFCIFYGRLKNTDHLRNFLNLTEVAGGPHIIIEIYRTWRKDSKHIVDSPLSELEGHFAFIMYDMSCDYIAIGTDLEGSVPRLYWGTDSEDNCVVSTSLSTVRKGCSRSYAQFPAGCLYTSTHGLMQYSHPLSILEPVPWTNNLGQVCGADFRTKNEIEGRFLIETQYPASKQ